VNRLVVGGFVVGLSAEIEFVAIDNERQLIRWSVIAQFIWSGFYAFAIDRPLSILTSTLLIPRVAVRTSYIQLLCAFTNCGKFPVLAYKVDIIERCSTANSLYRCCLKIHCNIFLFIHRCRSRVILLPKGTANPIPSLCLKASSCLRCFSGGLYDDDRPRQSSMKHYTASALFAAAAIRMLTGVNDGISWKPSAAPLPKWFIAVNTRCFDVGLMSHFIDVDLLRPFSRHCLLRLSFH